MSTTASGFAIDFDADARFVSAARMFAASVARHFGCDEDTIQDVKVAVSEACSNSLKARASAAPEDRITLRIERTDGGLRFDVLDRGAEVASLVRVPPQRPTSVDDPQELLEGAVGLVLIQALFPDVEVKSNDPHGTIVRFSVNLNGNGPS